MKAGNVLTQLLKKDQWVRNTKVFYHTQLNPMVVYNYEVYEARRLTAQHTTHCAISSSLLPRRIRTSRITYDCIRDAVHLGRDKSYFTAVSFPRHNLWPWPWPTTSSKSWDEAHPNCNPGCHISSSSIQWTPTEHFNSLGTQLPAGKSGRLHLAHCNSASNPEVFVIHRQPGYTHGHTVAEFLICIHEPPHRKSEIRNFKLTAGVQRTTKGQMAGYYE
jgi:hypothetical protein